jgi:hypothetical protein
MEFFNSQINMGRRKKGYLQRFGKIDLPKSKKGNSAAWEERAHTGVERETECQADRELAYMPIHPRILLTKMQSSFAKPLDRSFVDFFVKTGMQSPFAKLLELLLRRVANLQFAIRFAGPRHYRF